MVSACWEELTEFVKGLLDHSSMIAPPQCSNRPYRASDSMIHHAYFFTQLRKPATAPGLSVTPTK